MTKPQIKTITLNVSWQLNTVAKGIYNCDLVTAINHDQLKDMSAALDNIYGVLDTSYQRSMKAGIDEFIEYSELIKKHINTLAEYSSLKPLIDHLNKLCKCSMLNSRLCIISLRY